MAYAFDDFDELPPKPTRAEVEADLTAWCGNLAALLDTIEEWVADRRDIRPIRNNIYSVESRMLSVGIKTAWPFPSLTLHKYDGDFATSGRPTDRMLHVTSESPWGVGSRGSVRIWSPRSLHNIADAAMAGPPVWRMVHPDGLHTIPFTRENFIPLLSELD